MNCIQSLFKVTLCHFVSLPVPICSSFKWVVFLCHCIRHKLNFKMGSKRHLLANKHTHLLPSAWHVLFPSLHPPSSLALLPATVSLPATIVTSSVPTSVAGHMMYPSPHTVMYASTPSLDGGLAVLNAFSQGTSAMQVSHAQGQDTGETHRLVTGCQINITPWEYADGPSCVFPTLRCCPSGVPHSTSRHGADPCLSGAATPSTARSAFYKWNSHIPYATSMPRDRCTNAS